MNQPAPTYAIDVQKLNKHFGDKHVVNDVSLQVARGEIFGFLGPNGSLGYDIVRESAQIKRNVGYMTQRFSYWDDLTIRENLDFVARIYEMPNRREAVERSLESLGLQSRANQLTGALSGGWKQRLALAACMLHEPQLLLLDEPTAGVDPTARRDFWEELHRLAARGISVLVSTHYMDEAERCHKLAYIAYGKLLAQGTAREVIESQNLATWTIYGEHLSKLSEQLRKTPGVDQTVVFGSALHVSGIEHATLEAAVKQAIQGTTLRAERIETGLEDVFIYLMSHSTDNYGAPS
jgi:ABC-2 type transport system ATP-binding protein